MRRSWGDEYTEAHSKRFVDFDDDVEDAEEDEGPLFGFERAADHAYDEDFLAEEAGLLIDDE